jgi:cell division protein ZapA
MSSRQNRTEVLIHGSTYTISGEIDPEYIHRLASFLSSKMGELSISIPNATPLKLAVLAALNISDELFQYKDLSKPDLEKNSLAVEEKTKRLIHLLDEGLIGDIYQ